MVLDFLTKPVANIETGPKPFFFVNIVLPNGEKINKRWSVDIVDYYAATDSCYVQMGKSYVKGNLKKYVIHIDEQDFKLDLELTGTIESWRPYTGTITFDYNKFFSWLVAVPDGKVTGKYVYNGKTKTFNGTGYHDHNWGNYPMDKLIHHWYWGRIKFGNYAVIAANITTEKKFGYKDFPLFVVFKDGKVIADVKSGKVEFYSSTPKPVAGKPVSQKLMFVYKDKNQMFLLNLRQKQIISTIKLVQTLVKNQALAKSLITAGYDATYYRMTGFAKLMQIQDSQVKENLTSSKAIWELMYFGKCID
jgi:hypothetical protein